MRLRKALGESVAETFLTTDDGGTVAKRLVDDLVTWGNTPQGTIAANKGGSERLAGFGDWDRQDGRVRVLSKGQKLADLIPPGSPGADVSLDRFAKAVVTGNWRGLDPDLKTMAYGSGALGGYLVPDPLSARVIDLARNQAVVFRAGAQTVPMDSATLTIARVAGDHRGSALAPAMAAVGA